MTNQPTIQDLWKHISNKIANKSNDPFDDLFATIIPINEDGTFGTEISSLCDEYEGDTYTMVRRLLQNTDLLPTGSFAYFCPAKAQVVDDASEVGHFEETGVRPSFIDKDGNDTRKKLIIMSIQRAITIDRVTGEPEDVVMDSGTWWIDDNRFEELAPVVNGNESETGQIGGSLAIAFGALAFKWAIDHDTLGEIGGVLKDSLEIRRQAAKQAVDALNSLGKRDIATWRKQ